MISAVRAVGLAFFQPAKQKEPGDQRTYPGFSFPELLVELSDHSIYAVDLSDHSSLPPLRCEASSSLENHNSMLLIVGTRCRGW
jgi:hypothetical protein